MSELLRREERTDKDAAEITNVVKAKQEPNTRLLAKFATHLHRWSQVFAAADVNYHGDARSGRSRNRLQGLQQVVHLLTLILVFITPAGAGRHEYGAASLRAGPGFTFCWSALRAAIIGRG